MQTARKRNGGWIPPRFRVGALEPAAEAPPAALEQAPLASPEPVPPPPAAPADYLIEIDSDPLEDEPEEEPEEPEEEDPEDMPQNDPPTLTHAQAPVYAYAPQEEDHYEYVTDEETEEEEEEEDGGDSPSSNEITRVPRQIPDENYRG